MKIHRKELNLLQKKIFNLEEILYRSEKEIVRLNNLLDSSVPAEELVELEKEIVKLQERIDSLERSAVQTERYKNFE